MRAGMQEKLTDFLSRLERLVNMDTPSGHASEINEMGAVLQREFEAAGCEVTVHERSGGNLLECRLGHGQKQILLLGHMDTVFPSGEAAARPFRQEGGSLYGPGVLDMKSGLVMILEIMRHFAGRIPEGFRLCALLNCDEEIGSRQSRERIMELGRESAACLCMEPSKPGYCTVARKGLITFRIRTRGVAAHSGVNYHLGFSAIQGLCHIVQRLYTLRDDEGGISVNIGGISGGVDKGNIVADSAQCIGEVRFYEPGQEVLLRQALADFASDTGVENVSSELEIIASRPPMKQTDASRRLYHLACEAARKNGLRLEGRTHGGCSDGSLVASAGTPTIDGMGAEGSFSHTVEEYVVSDTLLMRLKTCIDLIEQITSEEWKL